MYGATERSLKCAVALVDNENNVTGHLPKGKSGKHA